MVSWRPIIRRCGIYEYTLNLVFFRILSGQIVRGWFLQLTLLENPPIFLFSVYHIKFVVLSFLNIISYLALSCVALSYKVY